jgi:TolC family type I secretion outer membrane protein
MYSKLISSVILLAALCSGSIASEVLSHDPFNTDTITPPRPQLELSVNPDFTPCQSLSDTALVGVIDVLDQALCRNPKTSEFWASARYQAALVGAARAPFFPRLYATDQINKLQSKAENRRQHSASLTLSWLLFDFGTRSAALENARQLLDAATSTLDATVQTVFLTALQAYYGAQASRSALLAAKESEKAAQQSLTAAQTRYKAGTATLADQLQAQTAFSQAILNRVKAEGTLQSAYGMLANVMGVETPRTIQLDELPAVELDTTLERNVEALIKEARQQRPDLAAAEAQVYAAQANVNVAKATLLPTISLNAGPAWQNIVTSGSSITTPTNSIGLTLSLPIFSGFENAYRIRAAQAKVDVATAQRNTLRLQVALDVWTEYQFLITANHSIKTTADLLASAEQSAHVARARYRAGVGTMLDVLNAQSTLASARVQRIQSTVDWHLSRVRLAKAIGTLDGKTLGL